MDLLTWNKKQQYEALSDTNRYFYKLHFGYDAKSDDELMLYYADFGASIFAHLHKGELNATRDQNID